MFRARSITMLNQVKLRNLQKLKYENNFGVNCKIKNGKLKIFFFQIFDPTLILTSMRSFELTQNLFSRFGYTYIQI